MGAKVHQLFTAQSGDGDSDVFAWFGGLGHAVVSFVAGTGVVTLKGKPNASWPQYETVSSKAIWTNAGGMVDFDLPEGYLLKFNLASASGANINACLQRMMSPPAE